MGSLPAEQQQRMVDLSLISLLLLSITATSFSFHGPAAVSYFYPHLEQREVRPSEHWYTVIKTMFGTPAQFRMGHQLARQDDSDNIVAKRSRNNKFRRAYGFGKRKRSMLPVFPEDDLNN